MIVIPMAGLSSRFKKAGFDQPKYMLEARGQTLFNHSVLSFERYFKTEQFLFIILDVHDTSRFVEKSATELGISNYKIVVLDGPTRGQAETVYLGLKAASVEKTAAITIFNIDTFRPGFSYPESFNICDVDGYLETFIGTGANWSNVLPESPSSNKVLKTAEKQEISEFCCTGLYYFRNVEKFLQLFEKFLEIELTDLQGGEFYIAPMYNDLIEENADIRFSIIDEKDVVFCGVPDEYYAFIDDVDGE